MRGIELKNGCVFYYGSPAGYVDEKEAVVDSIFRGAELEAWIARQNLAPRWTEGVYDRLAEGIPASAGENAQPLKACRIWQLRPDVDVMMKFIGYDEMARNFGEPRPEDYTVAYDGQIATNDLEAVYDKFSANRLYGSMGHPLSMSDVVELYDHAGSEFHYLDRFGFRRIGFDGREPEQASGMSMSL